MVATTLRKILMGKSPVSAFLQTLVRKSTKRQAIVFLAVTLFKGESGESELFVDGGPDFSQRRRSRRLFLGES